MYFCTYIYPVCVMIHVKKRIKIYIISTLIYYNYIHICVASYLNVSYKCWSQLTKPMYISVVTVPMITFHVWYLVWPSVG